VNILITGGTGSLGTALCEMWHKDHKLTVISRNDHRIAEMRSQYPEVVFYSLDLGNPNNYKLLLTLCGLNDYCIHAAAQKVVGEGEYQPLAYLTTNIMGVLYTLQAWQESHQNCSQFLFVSSDKAVEPINFYGMTKGVGTGLARFEHFDGSVIRYGNVVTSKGSFIQAWKQARQKDLPIVVRVGRPSGEVPTRFFLTMKQAVGLIEEAMGIDRPGIYIPGNLMAFNLMDVAQATGCEIVTRSVQAGEKLHEVLIARGESWTRAGVNLGRVSMPHWPSTNEYYAPFQSNTARRMRGAQVLEMAGWYE